MTNISSPPGRRVTANLPTTVAAGRHRHGCAVATLNLARPPQRVLEQFGSLLPRERASTTHQAEGNRDRQSDDRCAASEDGFDHARKLLRHVVGYADQARLLVRVSRGADGYELALLSLDALAAAAVGGLTVFEVKLAVAFRALFGHARW